jgi:AraC-like DNA-binding protein
MAMRAEVPAGAEVRHRSAGALPTFPPHRARPIRGCCGDQRAAVVPPKVRIFRCAGIETIASDFGHQRLGLHRDDGTVLVLVEAGCAALSVGDVQTTLGPGHIGLLAPDTAYMLRSLGQGAALHRFHVPTEAMRAAAEVMDTKSDSVGSPGAWRAVCDQPGLAARLLGLQRATRTRPEALHADQTVSAALAAWRAQSGCPEHQPVHKPSAVPPGIRRAKAMIDAAPEAVVRLDALAAAAGLSRFHFVRVFARSTGQTPHSYRTSRRINAARRMLSADSAPADVAAACGFADQSHLTRTFRRLLGVTPAVYARAIPCGAR